MAKLPQDIIIDILSRLPVKSLIRFKCVSKPWLSLISDSQFAKIQLKRSKSDNNGNILRLLLTTSPLQSIDYEAFSDGNNGTVSVQLRYPVGEIPEDDADIIGSCNGLVCLVFDSKNMVLWNPTTRVSKELPRHDLFPEQGNFFDGFGYDISGDDYKVIRGFISTNGNVSREAKVEVFSLKNNSWKEIHYFHFPWSIDINRLGVLSNDALYWLGFDNKYVIVSFDLTEERFKEVVSLPDHINQNTSVINLRNWGDRSIVFNDRSDGCFEAWEMKESWTRLFCISSNIFPEYEYHPTLVGFTKDGKALLAIDGGELVLYNSNAETFRYFEIHDEWHWFEGVIYEESLVSPIIDEASMFF